MGTRVYEPADDGSVCASYLTDFVGVSHVGASVVPPMKTYKTGKKDGKSKEKQGLIVLSSRRPLDNNPTPPTHITPTPYNQATWHS